MTIIGGNVDSGNPHWFYASLYKEVNLLGVDISVVLPSTYISVLDNLGLYPLLILT